MPQEPPPPPLPAKPGRFKTIVAWVCGPIVLVELIYLVGVMIWAAAVVHDGGSSKTYLSMARFLVGGLDAIPTAENSGPIPDSFYATNAELIMSRDVQIRAHARVHAMHPEMTPHPAKIEAKRLPGACILVLHATSDDEAYTTAILNAVMDEFLATRKELRDSKAGQATALVMDAIVKLEKEMPLAEQKIKAAEQGGASPDQLIEPKAELQQKKMLSERMLGTLRSLDSHRERGDVITILERPSPAALVVPRLSIFNLRK